MYMYVYRPLTGNPQLTLSRKLPIAELQRLKRQFLKLSSLHQVPSRWRNS